MVALRVHEMSPRLTADVGRSDGLEPAAPQRSSESVGFAVGVGTVRIRMTGKTGTIEVRAVSEHIPDSPGRHDDWGGYR